MTFGYIMPFIVVSVEINDYFCRCINFPIINEEVFFA